ncbi:MAG: sensor histidine kinase, partial [Candidatus Geothermincolia bacterium]
TVSRALERRQLRAATALYQASRAILVAEDLQRLPSVIVDVAMKVMGADDVSLMLPGADNTLYIAESRGLTPEVQAEVLAVGARVAGRVAASREPALIENGLATDPRFADVPSFRRVRSSIVYPLTARERLVGILNINRVTNPRPFRKQDLERASVLASQVLLALENRRLLQGLATSERLAAVGQLAAGVAHEINNPVTCVLSGHAFLREQFKELARLDGLFEEGADIQTLKRARERLGGKAFLEEVGQVLGEAEEGAIRIRDIVRDMRSLAKNDEEKLAVVDLNEPIRSALRVAGAEIRHRATVVTRLGLDVDVLGSAGRFSQVFVNLLVNAAQAIGERHGERNEIIVTSRREGDRVLAELSDTGPGIRPEHLVRLFEPFFTTKGATTGMGLGLSISRDIVRRYGGELRVESSPGQGAKFSIELPAAARIAVAPSAEQAQSRAAANETSRPRSRSRILFIDDEPSILRGYERSFGRDHDVVIAEGGSQALAMLGQRHDFNMIVCDLLMPDVSGMEVYRRAREAYPELDGTFVFVTGGVTQKEVQAFLRTVGNQVLEKPFDFGALREIIEVRNSGMGGMGSRQTMTPETSLPNREKDHDERVCLRNRLRGVGED